MRKLRAVSPKIISGIARDAEAIKWLAKLGIRWRAIMRRGRAPISSAAVQKSSSLKARNLERTDRASPGQSTRARMIVIPK